MATNNSSFLDGLKPVPMNLSAEAWDRIHFDTEEFTRKFRDLVRSFVPKQDSDEAVVLLRKMQDSTSCYSPFVWAPDYTPVTPNRQALSVLIEDYKVYCTYSRENGRKPLAFHTWLDAEADAQELQLP